jgi:hypothetical protein
LGLCRASASSTKVLRICGALVFGGNSVIHMQEKLKGRVLHKWVAAEKP